MSCTECNLVGVHGHFFEQFAMVILSSGKCVCRKCAIELQKTDPELKQWAAKHNE